MTNALIDAHADDPEFGYRFLADDLERAGHAVGAPRGQCCASWAGSGGTPGTTSTAAETPHAWWGGVRITSSR